MHALLMLPGGTSSKFRTGEDRDLISSWPICWANIAGIPWPSKIAGNDRMLRPIQMSHVFCVAGATQGIIVFQSLASRSFAEYFCLRERFFAGARV